MSFNNLQGSCCSFLLLISSFVLLTHTGCSRQVELTYTSSEEVSALDDEQQDSIQTLLTKFYGTPSDPLLMVLSDQPKEKSEDDESDLYDFDLDQKLDPDHLKIGAAVYQDRCASCHGVTGDGNGPAAPHLDPKPRDYRRGIFKFTSTGRSKPRKADLIRTVKYGARGTSMPSFRWLDESELSAVVDYVIVLAQRGETEGKLVILAEDDELAYAAEDAKIVYDSWKKAPSKLVQAKTPPPAKTEEIIQSGRHEFLVKGCAKCHGPNAQGFTTFPMKDAWGNPLYAANLTSGMLHGGRRDIDVYRRIYTGINGTPMPAFGPEFSPAYRDDPEKLWHLTYYVLSLADGREFPYVSEEEANAMAAAENAPPASPPMEEPAAEADPEPAPTEPVPEGADSDETDSDTDKGNEGDETATPEAASSDGDIEEDPRKATPRPPMVVPPAAAATE